MTPTDVAETAPAAALPIPEALLDRVRALADAFERAGHELYLVGGCVRDQMLGRPLHDVDLATDALPGEIKRIVGRAAREGAGHAGVYDVGAKFGTIGVIFRLPPEAAGERPAAPPGGDAAPGDTWTVEITTYRAEQYRDGTRKPEVTFGRSLEEDLGRRDFTINAMAREIRSGLLVDPFGGRNDIAARLIRAVGDAAARFRDDPLRLFRAVRFSAQLGFEIERETLEVIRAAAPELRRISSERIAQELTGILVSERPDHGIRLATDLGLIAYCIPEVLPMRGVSQRPLHHKDVFEHTLGVVRNIEADPLLRWTALLHDIGKPQTKSIQGGAVHFFGHEEVGARMARRILRRLHFEQRFVERVAKLISMHLRVNSYESDWSDAAVRRLVREAGDELPALIQLSRADVTSYRQERVQAAAMRADEFERRVRELQEQADIASLQSPLDGNDLMALFGKGPGPWIRPIKDYLLDLVIEGTLAPDDVETATELAKRYAAEHDLA